MRAALLVLFAFFFCTGNVAADEAGSLSLKQTVELAVKNSPEVLSAEQEVKLARLHIRDARLQFAPQITLSGTAARFNLDQPVITSGELDDRILSSDYWNNQVFTARVQALQTLYAGGRDLNNLKLAKVAYNRAQTDYSAVRSAKALEAKKAYFSLQYRRRLLELAEKTLAEMRGPLEGKKLSAFERIEILLQISALEGKKGGIELQEEKDVSALLRLISRDPLFSFKLDDDFSPIPVAETLYKCIVTATEYRAELRNEIYQAQMDDIAVNMAIVRHYPTVTLGAFYDLSAENLSDLSYHSTYGRNWMAMLSVRLPLSLGAWSLVSQRRLQQRQGELKRVEIQDSIRSEITSAYREADFWTGECQRLEKELENAEKLYSEISASADGVASRVRSAMLLFEMKTMFLKAVYNQREARASLEWARGLDFH